MRLICFLKKKLKQHSLLLLKSGKQGFAFILLVAMCGQTFNQGVCYINYWINKSAFEKNCINKTKAWLHCDGKCQLMKKIVESEKKDQSSPELKLTAKTEVLSSRSFFPVVPHFLNNTSLSLYIPFDIGTPIDRPSSFFHPPGI